jgi:hypothetical protein
MVEFETELVVEDPGVASIVLEGEASGNIAPGLTTVLKLRATPESQGEQSAVLLIRSNASNAPDGDVVIDVVAVVQ